MYVVVLTFICSLKAKYLPETLSFPISWTFICFQLQSSDGLHPAPNNSTYWSERWDTTLPTCLWKSSTACKSTQECKEFRKKENNCMIHSCMIHFMCMCVYVFYSFCSARTRWKWRSRRDQCLHPARNRDTSQHIPILLCSTVFQSETHRAMTMCNRQECSWVWIFHY